VPAQAWVYVFECQHKTYYVGFTRNLKFRLLQHFSGKGSVFTRRHRPIKLVLKHKANSELDEFETWLGFVALHGLKKVGGYNRILVYKLGLKWPFTKDESQSLVSQKRAVGRVLFLSKQIGNCSPI